MNKYIHIFNNYSTKLFQTHTFVTSIVREQSLILIVQLCHDVFPLKAESYRNASELNCQNMSPLSTS